MSIVSLADQKTYLGLTGTGDDQVLAQCIVAAQARVEQDTGRTFAYSSNVTRTYSTDYQASMMIRDVPWAASSNQFAVTLNGATLVYGQGFWLLPDRRAPEVSVTIQLRFYNRDRWDWYKADPQWWDKNMDNPRYAIYAGSPNDLVITGPEGHPNVPDDVIGMIKAVAALIYWQAKSEGSGTITTPTSEEFTLTADPPGYAEFVKSWRAHTAVAST